MSKLAAIVGLETWKQKRNSMHLQSMALANAVIQSQLERNALAKKLSELRDSGVSYSQAIKLFTPKPEEAAKPRTSVAVNVRKACRAGSTGSARADRSGGLNSGVVRAQLATPSSGVPSRGSKRDLVVA